MSENDISRAIVNACYAIHVSLGPGLFESVYEEILFHELSKSGFQIKRQQSIPVIWKSIKMEQGFRADLIVDDKVLVEIKSVDALAPVHKKQVLTYLKLSGLKLGLLINFNEELIRHGICRIANRL